MSIWTIIFAVVAIYCLIAAVICFYKGFDNDKIRNIGIVLFSLFFVFLMIAICFNTNRCDFCNARVCTAFCTQCGTKNENYVEPTKENRTGLMCPVCKVEFHTPYCGDCGSEIVFVEVVDTISGG